MRGIDRLLTAWLPAMLILASAVPAAGQPRGSSSSRAEFAIRMMRGMDANRNGYLEPGEINDRARPYIERYARAARLDLGRPMPVNRLAEAVSSYYRNQGGSGSSSSSRSSSSSPSTSRVEDELMVPGFGQVEDLPPIPGFGEDDGTGVKLEQADLDRADERLRRYDTNHDGFMDRNEARAGRWSDDPFRYDRNGDGRLNRKELAERYAMRRLAEQQQDRNTSSSNSSRSNQNDERPPDRDEQRRREEEERRRLYREIGEQIWRLAASLMQRYDGDRNGQLDAAEARSLGMPPASADKDGDHRVNRVELAQWLAGRSAEAGERLPEQLPDWFAQRDLNGDGQVVMAEFVDEWTEAKATEFSGYDLNQDGIIMPEELLRASSVPAGSYANQEFQIVPARGVAYAEIVVADETPVGDLDVQLSISHTLDETLDVFLIPPDGERIELFTGVGGSDDHFANTILDDEAERPITYGRPPFTGRYRPEAALKHERSLSSFRDKSIAGTWTLMVRAERSDRPAALHGWSLITKPVGAEVPELAEEDQNGDDEPSSRDQRPPSGDDEPRRYGGESRYERFSRGGYGPPGGSRPSGGRPPFGRSFGDRSSGDRPER